jgi:hypothetical protein
MPWWTWQVSSGREPAGAACLPAERICPVRSLMTGEITDDLQEQAKNWVGAQFGQLSMESPARRRVRARLR